MTNPDPGPADRAASSDEAPTGDRPAAGTGNLAAAGVGGGDASPDGAVGDDHRPEQEDPGTAPSMHPHWRVLLLAGIAAVVLAIDIVTKVAIVATIDPGENVRILGGLVYLTQIRNAGAAFSMATGMTWVLAIIAFAVVAFIIRMAPRLRSTPWAVCLGLILGGALGNLSDRVFRAPGFLQGHVVDFVSVFGPNAEYFPAFNAADSAISVGGVLLVLIALLGHDFDGRRRTRQAARQAASPAPAPGAVRSLGRGDQGDTPGGSPRGERPADG